MHARTSTFLFGVEGLKKKKSPRFLTRPRERKVQTLPPLQQRRVHTESRPIWHRPAAEAIEPGRNVNARCRRTSAPSLVQGRSALRTPPRPPRPPQSQRRALPPVRVSEGLFRRLGGESLLGFSFYRLFRGRPGSRGASRANTSRSRYMEPRPCPRGTPQSTPGAPPLDPLAHRPQGKTPEDDAQSGFAGSPEKVSFLTHSHVVVWVLLESKCHAWVLGSSELPALEFGLRPHGHQDHLRALQSKMTLANV